MGKFKYFFSSSEWCLVNHHQTCFVSVSVCVTFNSNIYWLCHYLRVCVFFSFSRFYARLVLHINFWHLDDVNRLKKWDFLILFLFLLICFLLASLSFRRVFVWLCSVFVCIFFFLCGWLAVTSFISVCLFTIFLLWLPIGCSSCRCLLCSTYYFTGFCFCFVLFIICFCFSFVTSAPAKN